MNGIRSLFILAAAMGLLVAANATGQNANFVVVGPTAAAAWDSSSGTWVIQPGSFTLAAGDTGNLAVAGGAQAAAFHDTSATWTTLGSGGSQIAASQGSFGVRGSGSASVWNQASSTWSTQPIAGVYRIEGSGGSFGASASGNVAIWGKNTATWTTEGVVAGLPPLQPSGGSFFSSLNGVDAVAVWNSNPTRYRVDYGGFPTSALASDGNFALFGSGTGVNQGSAWVWNKANNGWHQAFSASSTVQLAGDFGRFGYRTTGSLSTHHAQAWSANSSGWFYQPSNNGTDPWDSIAVSKGNVAVVHSNLAPGFVFAVFQESTQSWTLYNPAAAGTILVGSEGNFAYGGGSSSGQFSAWKPGMSAPNHLFGFAVPTQIVGAKGNFGGFGGGHAYFWNSANNTFVPLTGAAVTQMVGSEGTIGLQRSGGIVQAIKGRTSTPAWVGSGITATSPLRVSDGNIGATGVNSATRYTQNVGLNGSFSDLTITGVAEMKASAGNFVVRGSSEVAAIDDNSSSWNTLPLAANRIEASGGNAAALSSADSTVAAWDQADSTWYSLTSFANNGLTLAGSDGNFAALGLTSVAAWDQADNVWFTFSGTFTGLLGGGGNFVAYGSSGAAVFESDDNSWNFLDGDFSSLAAASIPEPGTFGLIGVGLGMLLWRRRVRLL